VPPVRAVVSVAPMLGNGIGPTGPCSDDELLAAHIAGDRHAFEELFRRHRDRLLRVARSTCRNPEDAADAVQDALLKAHRSAPSFRRQCSVSTWLHRIVVNACIDTLRRNTLQHNADIDLNGCALPDPTIRADTAMMVRRALLRLPVEQRAAVVAVDMHGYSIAEAAALLGVAEGTVKSRRARARTRLAAALRPPVCVPLAG
jgi:RNA polymerase sigma-70 factor, ECF subfamily